MRKDNGSSPKTVNEKQRPTSIVPTALSEDVFLIIVDGFSKYESQTKICEKAGIQRPTLRDWLRDPNPTGIIKELHEAIVEIQASPQRQLFLKAQEILMQRLVTPRKTTRRTRIVSDTLSTQEYNKIVDQFGEGTAKCFRDVVEWRSSTVAIQETEINEEITADATFKIWSYLREELGHVIREELVDEVVVAINDPNLPES